ncbi:Gfo/Idh/MocA family protein [Cohnella fermenti]|uniref:Gfo/Idh/MocA family oxidoreductase n=1 Tax=Cohnella fermenti TaxID=2565925 RepID=A0A4S4C6H8_9BACL|nr:Gfo/Idh/MocA family oxidoreductase [Cohnella fermenti]THF83501.1 Gfo/Idh/MocA family oxidoreductase [Cohnella fermenti]
MNSKPSLAVVGAGARGLISYAPYFSQHPEEAEIAAVAEPNEARRTAFADQFGLPADRVFASWEQLLEQPRLCDALLISTQDRMHFEPVMAALRKGYHVLLEKPMSNDPAECVEMTDMARQSGLLLTICHVSRYIPFWKRLKALLAEGAIGDVVSIQHNENVGYLHYAHSFVRGNWRNATQSSPMILAKSCHDMDLIRWLIDSDCERVSSFGSLTHFRPENAPEGAADRCTDGCAAEASCPYSAKRFYSLDLETNPYAGLIADPPTLPNRMEAIRKGPYGKCVYRTDNDVVDHQVVNMEFANGATAMFSMCGFTRDTNRIVQIMGTKGEIRGDLLREEIDLFEFNGGKRTVFRTPSEDGGHHGGDAGILRQFLSDLREERFAGSLTSAEASLESHLMAFAAENSRLRQGEVVDLRTFRSALAAAGGF